MLKSIGSWIASILKAAATKLVVTGLLAVLSIYSAVQWWTHITNTLAVAWTWLLAPAGIARWFAGLLLFLSCWLLLAAGRSMWSAMISKKTLSWQEDYTQDTLFGVRVHWQNIGRNISRIHILCSKCASDCEQIVIPAYPPAAQFRCLSCGHLSDDIPVVQGDAVNRIDIEIRRRVNSGEWIERVTQDE